MNARSCTVDVPRQQRAVGQDYMVADGAIVRDVRVRHEKIVRADDRVLGGFVRAVNRDVFAKNILVADAQPRRLALVFQILRRVANHAARVEPVAGANRRQPGEINVRPDDAVRAQLNTGVNHGERLDSNRRVQLRLRMNDGRRMNHFRPQVHTVWGG